MSRYRRRSTSRHRRTLGLGGFSQYLPPVLIVLLATLFPGTALAQESPSCPDNSETLADWQRIYDQRAGSISNADGLTEQLLPCLGSPNPVLRDTYGYGLYTHWLRNEQLSTGTKQRLFAELLNNLDSKDSLLRSFSALILSEILRADAINSFLSTTERDSLQLKSSAALIAETDFRGFDEKIGWVHPVAHLADVHWRLALHPELTSAQASNMLEAIASKAVTDESSYIFNESDRLARVVAIIIRTEILDANDVATWLKQFSLRADGESWPTAFASVRGMAELHNAKGFVRALSNQLQGVQIPRQIEDQIRQLLDLFGQLV